MLLALVAIAATSCTGDALPRASTPPVPVPVDPQLTSTPGGRAPASSSTTAATPRAPSATPPGTPAAIPPTTPAIAPAATAATPEPPPAPVATPAASTVNVADLNYIAVLRGGPNGTVFLGTISSSRTYPDSICNLSGRYGSPTSLLSIRNPLGPYGTGGGDPGSPYFNSNVSARNPLATAPPRAYAHNTMLAIVTASTAFGDRSIDPDQLLAALGCP